MVLTKRQLGSLRLTSATGASCEHKTNVSALTGLSHKWAQLALLKLQLPQRERIVPNVGAK
ncbi:uncharacterized protein PHALS_12555 [Plasmopara halstedii]|uniref:Uncharacterized protein n=1 Tax=Plasmopara halstedii TaxID=4781 RepID=A0A0P1ALT0_PLAHL|nr:uncharacterized protein PHALS_12555 [Plasmopara halstedii]CEG42265.1 hypothetical protein PHALS_12555 [Plasmopara halstedii]|eukprot:XP_024578634.1 hypothetical protein PHALS_12555 [Plasmopara halstedii]